MTEPEKKSGEGDAVVDPKEFESLKGQLDNLNKGIASYRDQIKAKDEEITKIKSDFEVLNKKVEAKDKDDDKEISLDPEDEKRLEAWVKKKGFVSQDEFQAEKQKIQQETLKSIENQAVSEFLEKHKEYDKDEEWAKVQAEFQAYKTPTSLDGYRKLLIKIHSELTGGSTRAREDGKAQARAELIAKGRLSLGGGNQGGDDKTGPDMDNLQKRYPNLSKDQIADRLSEIKSLYPNKK